MAYSPQVLALAREKLARQKADRESQYNERLFQAYSRVPRLKQIDVELRKTMAVAAQAAFIKGQDAVAAMEKVRDANLALQKTRKVLIEENFAPGYLDENPVCEKCGGSGYLGATMCGCLQALCRQAQLELLSGLMAGKPSFRDFRLDYYPEQVDPNFSVSPRALMKRTLAACQKYAAEFDGRENLLFVGGTGLGKTFLSACIATQVAEKGFSVAYESAPQLFEKLNKNFFTPDQQSQQTAQSLSDCDLLIIDDLGTEMTNSFTVAALYSLLNDRLLAGKSMLISTNLNVEEIARRYSPQIASRLQGQFKALTFLGRDIRVLKNRGI